jgi:hypothetical protein
VEAFQTSADKFYTDLIVQLRPESFKNYEGIGDPKGLIKNITTT